MAGPIKLFECDRQTHKMKVTTTEQALLTDLGLNLTLSDHIALIQSAGDLWNVRVVSLKGMPDFLRDLERALPWCMLLLQECSALRKAVPPENIDGHRVIVVPPSGRGRQNAIITHRDCGWKVHEVIQGSRCVGAVCEHSEFGR
eukprot:5668621-Pyramimonas_sp.AAC.1